LILKKRANVRLEIGGSGTELGKLSDQVVQHGLQKEVKFCGWVEDIRSFVEGADLFVIPSRDEPFGIVVLESMACGVPIIASRTQGPTEILTDEMAYFFEPGDAFGLAEQVLLALSSAGRWSKAQAALEKLKQTYTQKQVVKTYERLYKKII
jgi:glycosyltransferase involved in cell wall biosynthesis